MDYGTNHFIRNILVDPGTAVYSENIFNLQLTKISSLDIKDDFHVAVHNHLCGEIIIPRKKFYECLVNDEKIRVNPGQLLIIQPFDKHEDFYHRGGELLFFIFNMYDFSGKAFQNCLIAAGSPLSARVLDVGTDSLLEQLLCLIMDQKAPANENPLVRLKLGEAFFWQMVSEIPKIFLSRQLAGSIGQRVFYNQVIEYFTGITGSKLDVRQLAARLKMSKRSLEYKFRAFFGASPGNAFTAYKIHLAKEMLEKGKSIKIVAEQLGFSDQFYFSTVFSRFMGFPPSKVLKKK